MHDVVALVADGANPFELAIVAEVFGGRHQVDVPAGDWYRFRVASADPGPLRTPRGFAIGVDAGLEALTTADTVAVPAWRDVDERPPEAMLDALRGAADRGVRILSVCSGAFVLAHAGLLDGRRATTHWWYTDRLARRFPAVTVDPDVLYVDGGQILTSAGSAGGIDLCLHVVRRDFGAHVANTVARSLVVPPHRDGGQAQFVAGPAGATADDAFGAVLDWARANLDGDLDVDALAARAAMSRRTFLRRFRDRTGTTPLRWVTHERVLAAQRRLETTDDPVEVIARECGFGSAATMRQRFRDSLATTPTAYRRTFAGPDRQSPSTARATTK